MGHSASYWMWFLLIGGLVGYVAGLITRGRGFGIPGDILVGVVGAELGGWVANGLGLYTSSSIGTFLVAIAGAVLLVGLTRFVKRVVASV